MGGLDKMFRGIGIGNGRREQGKRRVAEAAELVPVPGGRIVVKAGGQGRISTADDEY